MRKKQLEILLSQLTPIPKPKLKWEGYSLDVGSAAQIVYTAAYVHDDIRRKNIVDLGCGSGILSIAASVLGADWVVGVDIDKEAVKAAKTNAMKVGAVVDYIIGDIECIAGRFNVTLMNPPFGSWRRGADIQFLKKALQISSVVYSLHKGSASVREFLSRRITQIGGRIDQVYEMQIIILKTYSFHKMKRYPVKVNFYRIIKQECSD